MREQRAVWIGIDVAKRWGDVQIGDDGPTRRYPNTVAGHRRLLAELACVHYPHMTKVLAELRKPTRVVLVKLDVALV